MTFNNKIFEVIKSLDIFKPNERIFFSLIESIWLKNVEALIYLKKVIKFLKKEFLIKVKKNEKINFVFWILNGKFLPL